jgi:hypothetical protein
MGLLLFLNLSVIYHMKYVIIFITITILYGCHAEKTVELANGQCITERQYEKRLKKAYRKIMREMSKEDRKTLRGINLKVETSEK